MNIPQDLVHLTAYTWSMELQYLVLQPCFLPNEHIACRVLYMPVEQWCIHFQSDKWTMIKCKFSDVKKDNWVSHTYFFNFTFSLQLLTCDKIIGSPWEEKSFSSLIFFMIILVNFCMWYCIYTNSIKVIYALSEEILKLMWLWGRVTTMKGWLSDLNVMLGISLSQIGNPLKSSQ